MTKRFHGARTEEFLSEKSRQVITQRPRLIVIGRLSLDMERSAESSRSMRY